MDPDEALRAGRQAVDDWEAAEPGSRAEQEAAERATGAFAALDDWLSHGGFLPAAWQHDAANLASCGHPANEDGECDCSSWPERPASFRQEELR